MYVFFDNHGYINETVNKKINIMAKTISEPKDVQIGSGGTPGILKMSQKRVVADFATYSKVVNALSQGGTHKDALKSQAGDKNVTELTKSTDSLTEAIITFGQKHGYDKLAKVLEAYGEDDDVALAKDTAVADMEGDFVGDELEGVPTLAECGDEPIKEGGDDSEGDDDLPEEM